MDWSLDQIENLYISMASIRAELDAIDQECPQYISQEESQCFSQYEVSDILDEF